MIMVNAKQYFIFCAFMITATYSFLWFWMNAYESTLSRKSIIAAKQAMPDTRFILVWTLPTRDPIMNLGRGIETFVTRNCAHINCYVSPDRMLFEDLREFDVLVFHAPELAKAFVPDLPKIRSPHQKYVFASMESADYYPICDEMFDSFFNWTWTYKLNSDEIYGYITIRNKEGDIIGPNAVMHWKSIETMDPIDDKIKAKLSNKQFAAAWFVSNCYARNDRLEIANKLKAELARYNLILDIYGACGIKTCPSVYMEECLRIVERDYYFYLSFENSFSEDYVTEKLLHGLQHFTVPIVYGSANYTRFMPDGIYLNAKTLGVKELALKMSEIIEDKDKYYNFFRWHNHYSYHSVEESPESDSYCKLCALISNKDLFSNTSIQQDFTNWWNPSSRC